MRVTTLERLLAIATMALGAFGCGAEPQDSNAPDAGADASSFEVHDRGIGRAAAGTGQRINECASVEGGVFADVSECVGLDALHTISDLNYYAIGQAWGDYDADGWLDLYVTDADGPNRLYHNQRDGTFLPTWQDLPSSESAGAMFVDYDNDGWQDLYVLNRGPNVLYHNVSGRFVDVTEAAGVGDPGQGQSAAWADFDADGWLDLYVVNWLLIDRVDHQLVHSADALYHSNGDGTFEDVTALLDPTKITGAGFVASWTDYDDDGDLDLYVVNDKGGHGSATTTVTNHMVLFRNDGAGCGDATRFSWCFTEVSEAASADLRMSGMGLAPGDYDNDGDIDLYVTDQPRLTALLQNQGDGTFIDVAEHAGAWGDTVGFAVDWGTVFLDYDHDGWLDLYVAREGSNLLLRNVGGTFDDVSAGSGADEPGYGMGVATADYDRDGNVDLLLGYRGEGYRLLRNTGRAGAGRHWLTVRLVGSGPVNRDAVGARVIVRTTDGRSLMREVICGSSLGAGSELASHFGLGDATVAELEIRWPDGRFDRHRSVPSDREITYTYE